MTRRNPNRDHLVRPRSRAQELLDAEDEVEDDGEEEVEPEEASGEELPPGRDRRQAGRGTASEDTASEEGDDDEDDEEQVRDPVRKAVADTEARMRKKYVKPLRAEVERLKQEAGNAQSAVETVRSLRLENEFLRLAGGTFHDAAAAFKLADVKGVEITDDGTITGMDAAVEALAESHPYLVRDEVADDEDDEDDDYEAPDLPSGRPMNSGRRTSATGPKTNDAALYKRYPALQRRRGW